MSTRVRIVLVAALLHPSLGSAGAAQFGFAISTGLTVPSTGILSSDDGYDHFNRPLTAETDPLRITGNLVVHPNQSGPELCGAAFIAWGGHEVGFQVQAFTKSGSRSSLLGTDFVTNSVDRKLITAGLQGRFGTTVCPVYLGMGFGVTRVTERGPGIDPGFSRTGVNLQGSLGYAIRNARRGASPFAEIRVALIDFDDGDVRDRSLDGLWTRDGWILFTVSAGFRFRL